ncbi:hypothetical protein [Edaphobacter bradus]|uniref:hypothetical protein n=1 Tax=Edaphobacter bradus TaxID=2259016 RepID=UPI0021E072C7|nr:hypothetical protein [Edaphobacter bradus]
MKATWFLSTVLAASALSAPAFGQVSIGVTIGTPPPPIQYEVAPPPPQVGYVWIGGYWTPNDGRYVWYPGRWVRPPYEDGEWRAARWEHGDHGWRYREGYWAHHDNGRHEGWGHHGDWDDEDGDHHGHGHAYGHYKHGHDD